MEEEHALFMYHQMWLAGMQPDAYTFATLVKACSLLTALEQGRKIHANVMKWNCACDPFVTASLVDRKAIEGSQRLNALLFSLMPLVVWCTYKKPRGWHRRCLLKVLLQYLEHC
ncbi:variant 2, Pentatricopeptide repeat-containing protein [Lathyrus oleraceus]|uniref:Variant 2, Pentatricopeptide repeat-containing protein n=1 Tax=Pisum sativum TaxID=3888 RepID=A0A9D5A569_PEA|nr:variant 2, Pentatricopeptide repeat-containing protein [Pisum sativum]